MLWKLCKEGTLTCDPHNWESFSVSDFSHHRLQNIWGRTIHKFHLPYSCFVAFMFWRMPSKLYQSFIFILPKSKYFCHQLNLSNFVKPQGIEWGQNRLSLPKEWRKNWTMSAATAADRRVNWKMMPQNLEPDWLQKAAHTSAI